MPAHSHGLGEPAGWTGSGPLPAGTAVGRATGSPAVPDSLEPDEPAPAPFDVVDGESGADVALGVSVAVGVSVGVGVSGGVGVGVAAVTIDRSVEAQREAAVFLLLHASTVKLLPAGVPAATCTGITMLRVSPIVAPVQVHVRERRAASMTHPVSPVVDVGVPKVPLPAVPSRSTVTAMSPVVSAVNVPVAVTLVPGSALDLDNAIAGVASDRTVSVADDAGLDDSFAVIW